jgi:hypothetical protein
MQDKITCIEKKLKRITKITEGNNDEDWKTSLSFDEAKTTSAKIFCFIKKNQVSLFHFVHESIESVVSEEASFSDSIQLNKSSFFSFSSALLIFSHLNLSSPLECLESKVVKRSETRQETIGND